MCNWVLEDIYYSVIWGIQVKSKKVGTDEGKPYLHPQNSVELVVVLVSKERERERERAVMVAL
jgi:hypothetical protein